MASVVFVKRKAIDDEVAEDLRTLKASFLVLKAWPGDVFQDCIWHKLKAIQRRLKKRPVLTGQNDKNGKPEVKEAQFICLRGRTLHGPLLLCGRKPLCHKLRIKEVKQTPDGGYVQFAQYLFHAPVLDSQQLNIGVVQSNTGSGSTTAVAGGYKKLARRICKMQLRMLVGDIIDNSDPLLKALSEIVRITAVQGKENDPSRFCVVGGVSRTSGCHSVETLQKTTKNYDYENFRGIPKLTAKWPNYFFLHHHKSLMSLQGNQGNRSDRAKAFRAANSKQRKRIAKSGAKHRGSGDLSPSGDLSSINMEEL